MFEVDIEGPRAEVLEPLKPKNSKPADSVWLIQVGPPAALKGFLGRAYKNFAKQPFGKTLG
jgi:hypothetical protein